MPFLSPTVTFTRYMVKDPLEDNFWTSALDEISARAFREKDVGITEMATGWAPLKDPFKEEITLEDISFSDHLLLSLRIDKRSVPASLLKKFCAVEEKRVMAERELQRITSKMRKEIRERVKFELLTKSLPVPSTYDLCWNISTGTVYFFCRQDKICGIFEDLFKTTFNLRLYPVIPHTLGLQVLKDKDAAMVESFNSIRPEVFV